MQFPNPERILARAFHWFLFTVALLVAIPVLALMIANIRYLLPALVVAGVAWAIRAGTIGQSFRRDPVRNRGGSERTPILPAPEDEQ